MAVEKNKYLVAEVDPSGGVQILESGDYGPSDIANIVLGLAGKEDSFTKNTAFNKNFGTTVGTIAQGNDSRILNGQTAYGWGDHAGIYLPLTGGKLTGDLEIEKSVSSILRLDTTSDTSTSRIRIEEDGVNAFDILYLNSAFDGGIRAGHMEMSMTGTKFMDVDPSGNVTFLKNLDITNELDANTIREGGTLLSNKYAPVSHTHTYLPLTGGTLTGDLTIDGTVYSDTVISKTTNTDLTISANGTGIVKLSSNLDLNGSNLVANGSIVSGGSANVYIDDDLEVTGDLGLNGSTPVSKGVITGSRGENAALASLLTYLASRGDLTDSTTI